MLGWRVHVHDLFKEIADNSQQGIQITAPLQITLELLKRIAQRAIEINDPEMNKLMIRLSLYSISDPHDPEYNPKLVSKLLEE